MRSHFQRVQSLKEERDQNYARALKKHIILLSSVGFGLVLFTLLGALLPDFYDMVDRIPPIIQLITALIMMSVFAYWRLRKMLKR